jgi:transcriptional regulator with XRE-family HTH domain
MVEELQLKVRLSRGRYRELAEKSGMSVSWISQFGRGLIHNPTINTVKSLQEALIELEATNPDCPACAARNAKSCQG